MQTLRFQGMLSVKVLVDILWVAWFVLAFVFFEYLGTFIDGTPELSIKAQYGFGLVIGSSFATALLVGYRPDVLFTNRETRNSAVFIIVSVIAAIGVNAASKIQMSSIATSLSSLPLASSVFVMLIAVGEESARAFLLPLFIKMNVPPVIANIAAAGLLTVFHAAVYGLLLVNIIIVFFCFLAFGFALIGSGYRVSIPMTAHGVINFLANLVIK